MAVRMHSFGPRVMAYQMDLDSGLMQTGLRNLKIVLRTHLEQKTSRKPELVLIAKAVQSRTAVEGLLAYQRLIVARVKKVVRTLTGRKAAQTLQVQRTAQKLQVKKAAQKLQVKKAGQRRVQKADRKARVPEAGQRSKALTAD